MKGAVPFLKQHWLASVGTVLAGATILTVLYWLRAKTTFALTMEAIGINWTNPEQVSDGDKLNFVVGLGLGVVGLLLTVVGVWLTLGQRELSLRERSRKSVLRLDVPHPGVALSDGPSRYELFIANDGDKDASSGYWYLGVPKRLRARLNVDAMQGHELVQYATDGVDILHWFDSPLVACFTDDFYLVKGRALEATAQGDLKPCGIIEVRWEGQELIDARLRTLLWFTNSPSGRWPTTGMKKLRLYARSEIWFKAYHGGQEPPPDDDDIVAVSPGPVDNS